MRGVAKRYPSRADPVLRGVDLVVERGTVVHVGGDNGAGKTTLLRIVTGVIAPDAGEVRVLGSDPSTDRRAAQRATGFVAAGNAGLYARLTVAQHLDIWARIAFVPKRQHRSRVDGLLARFELGALAGERCDRLSMGQRQRLRLAIGLIGDPVLVLLDEPLTSLDGSGRALLAGVLDDVVGRGGAVAWCSPDTSDVPLPAAQTYRLAGGTLDRVASS